MRSDERGKPFSIAFGPVYLECIVDYHSFLNTNRSLIDALFGKIKAVLQPSVGGGTATDVPDNEQMLKLRRAVQELTDVVLPCIELTDKALFQRIGILFFWQFGRGLSKEGRYEYQNIALGQVPDYRPMFTAVRDLFDKLELSESDTEVAKHFGELLARLHPASAERFKPSEQTAAQTPPAAA